MTDGMIALVVVGLFVNIPALWFFLLWAHRRLDRIEQSAAKEGE